MRSTTCGGRGANPAALSGIETALWDIAGQVSSQPLYNLLGGTVWASAVVVLGYFLWASISQVEHWVGRASLLLLAVLAFALLLRWAYRRVTRG